MPLEPPTELEKSITTGHSEQIRNALSTTVAAELDDRDLDIDDQEHDDEDIEIEPVRVTVDELVKATPIDEPKCRLLMAQFAGEPGTGISAVDENSGRYEIDPQI
jgi:hypothetical protein